MGVVITKRQLLRASAASYPHPFVYCCEIAGATDDAVPLNVRLAKELSGMTPRRISLRMEELFLRAIDDLPEGAVICNFDVLFNPAYNNDVVMMLASAYRKKHFDVLWPGTIDGARLVYAEEGYADYRAFDIEKYDITCVR